MKHYIVATVLSLLFVPPALAEPELKGSPTELANYLPNLPRLVTVTGEGEVKVPADRAVITLRVSTENKALAEALQANEAVRSKLATFLKEHGFRLDQIHASRFSSTQKYSAFSEKVKSHRVENLVKVTVHDEKQFQTVAGTLDKFSEVSYVGADFEHSDKEAMKAKAVAEACDQANSRKKVYEERLGLKLTPRRFSEGNIPADLSVIHKEVQSVTAASLSLVTGLPSENELRRHALASRGETSSAFGELVFRVFVSVEYSVENK